MRQLFSGWYDMYYYWGKSSTSWNINICNSNTNGRISIFKWPTKIHSISSIKCVVFCHPAQFPEFQQRHDLQSWRSKPHISPPQVSPKKQGRCFSLNGIIVIVYSLKSLDVLSRPNMIQRFRQFNRWNLKVIICLVGSTTHLKKIFVKNGNLPQIGVKITNVWNHRPVIKCVRCFDLLSYT